MTTRALLIGCNYPGTTSALTGCTFDARDWCLELQRRDIAARTLLNRQATKQAGHAAARRLLDALEPGDWAWFWFSGHGTVDTDTGGDEPTGYDQAIVWNDFELDFDDEFAALLASRAHPRETFVFAGLDCCHSRTMHRAVRPRAIRAPRAIPFARCRPHRRDRTDRAPRALPGVVLFAGCGDGPTDYSFDGEFDGRPNGAFTYYALRTLRLLPRGATFADWFRRLGGRRPPGALPTAEYPQQPAYQASRALFRRPIPIL